MSVKKRIVIYCIMIMMGVCGLCGMFINRENKNVDNLIHNRAKIILNNCIYQANKGNLEPLKTYSFCIIDLQGKVLNTNKTSYTINDVVAMQNVSGNAYGTREKDKYIYSAPYLDHQVQKGTIFVSIPYKALQKRTIWTYIIVAGIFMYLLGILCHLCVFVKRDILIPLSQVHTTTLKIKEGEYEDKIRYDCDGEVGTLCHDFEALREDLEYSRKNEQKLKLKEKLLLAYISHDLRTPIASISGYVEGIQAGIVKGEKIQDYTAIIMKKIAMLNGLIDDILEHSKAQLQEFSIQKEECYAADYFSSMLKEAKSDIEKNGLTFTCNSVPNVLLNIDPKRIKQVMQNLIGNAIKFTKEGTISIKFIVEGNKLYIGVTDTGIGIPAIDQPQIFEEFYRSEKARTLNVPGFGLGLSIAKYIVENHNGKITCDSVLDQGTTIEFYLPVA